LWPRWYFCRLFVQFSHFYRVYHTCNYLAICQFQAPGSSRDYRMVTKYCSAQLHGHFVYGIGWRAPNGIQHYMGRPNLSNGRRRECLNCYPRDINRLTVSYLASRILILRERVFDKEVTCGCHHFAFILNCIWLGHFDCLFLVLCWSPMLLRSISFGSHLGIQHFT
jgi:hypothetical protein